MAHGSIDNLMKEYDEKISLYSDFSEKLELLIREILKNAGQKVHSITSRTKQRDSFSRKIKPQESSYREIADITDIAGVRIITYFEDDVDVVAEIVKREFILDMDNSIDKREALEPDRFGYLSLHYVVELDDNRTGLIEYKRFPHLKAEIQIRSILQHAWAEIEHDLGYKTKLSIPKEIRRQFSRVAGLLEIADNEFISIRKKLDDYSKSVVKKIEKSPGDVEINSASLKAFINTSRIVVELSKKIVHAVVSNIDESENPDFIERHIAKLRYLDINTISELHKLLIDNSSIIVNFAKEWIIPKRSPLLHKSISLFYLCYVIIAKKGSSKEVYEYLDWFKISGAESAMKNADRIISIYNKLKMS